MPPTEYATRQAPAPLVPLTDQQHADLEKWWLVQPTVSLPIPDDGSKVTVVGFSDFQCPHCRSAHETYRGIVAKYAGNKQVRFLFKHFPLEGECNTNAVNGNHFAACEAAAAVVMARATGKANAMSDWLYDNQANLTPGSVREAAKSVAHRPGGPAPCLWLSPRPEEGPPAPPSVTVAAGPMSLDDLASFVRGLPGAGHPLRAAG